MIRSEFHERLTRCYWEAAGVIVAGLALGYGVYSGEEGQQQQKKGQRRQEQAQRQAQAAAARQQKLSAEAYAAANRRQPDVGDILATEAELGKMGAASTLLTGPTGPKKNPGRPTTLLGE